MSAFALGDIAIGGRHHYIEIINSSAAFSQMIHVLDDSGDDTQTYITGVTFRPPTRELFSVSTPSLTMPFVQHDVDWIPNDSGLLIALVPSAGVLKFRKVNFAGATQQEWTPAIEPGWGQQPVKISVACDSTTVFYTMSLKKIKCFDLNTGTNKPDIETLPSSSPYIYGGIRILPGGTVTEDGKHFIVAMTATGNGPRHAVCLDSDKLHHWVDEINTPDTYHIQKRLISTGAFVSEVETRADALPTPTNDETLALACLYNPCGIRIPLIVTLIA